MFFNVLFAGMIAFNFYEPLAALLVDDTGDRARGFADTLCLMVLFIVSLLHAPADDRDRSRRRWSGSRRRSTTSAGSSSAWPAAMVTIAILLLAFETRPGAQEDLRRDRLQARRRRSAWASTASGSAFFQYTTGQVFVQHGRATRDPFRRVRRRQGLRPQGRMAPRPPGGPPLRPTESILALRRCSGGLRPLRRGGAAAARPRTGRPRAWHARRARPASRWSRPSDHRRAAYQPRRRRRQRLKSRPGSASG